ncbi:DUF5011 domain-containing protein [Winogradskyella alexanderae]|uniref:DUF5011 domain-containing protein n=1 Tax=Winogradskyella alexanderae TaxID=2877123 RepID=A0ABS7XXZ7_9FLAO|nr:DUF5011 domain-containing protein [Winogradskyella alexanderae]MCA0133866.1 DUF5011 domain-containing protein [Winogradskyella alexanderae]
MRYSFILLCAFLMFFSCSTDNNNPVDPALIEQPPSDGNVKVDIKVELPSNTTFSESDLEVISIFDSSTLTSSGISDIEIYNGDNLELVSVQNSVQEAVLFGLLDPVDENIKIIDVTSTAKAIVMLAPWSIGLSKEEKIQALSLISTLSGYDSFLTEVEQGIKSQDLTNVNPQEIQNQLVESFFSRTSNSDIDGNFGPLDVIVENTALSVYPEWETNINISYSLKLFKNGVLQDDKMLLGNLVSQGVIDLLFNGIGSSNSTQQVDFTLPTSGLYELKARNGSSLSDDHSDALIQNLSVTLYELIGVFSGSFNSLFSQNAPCLGTIINQIKGTTEFIVAFNQYQSGGLSNYDMALAFLTTAKEVIATIGTDGCFPSQSIVAGLVQTIVNVINVIQQGIAVINTGSVLYDWYTLPGEIDICVEKAEADYAFCNAISISAADGFNFGMVPVGQEVNKSITITNNSETNLFIHGINFENESIENVFSTDFTENVEVIPGGTYTFNLIFNGPLTNAINAEMIVQNSLDEINNKVTVSGEAINAIVVEPTYLLFDAIPLNEVSEMKTISVQNTSDYPTRVSYALNTNLSGFNVSPILFLTEIPANNQTQIQVTFQPTSVTETYNSDLEIVSNDTSQESISIELSGSVGDGIPPVISLIGNATIDLNAGDNYVELGATATDNVDGDISQEIVIGGDVVDTNNTGTYLVTYNVFDSAGNAADEVIRTVNVFEGDITPPVITLIGAATINLSVGDMYTELGATATDDVDGDISDLINIGGDIVDTDTAGTYIITYNVSDAAGNDAVEVIRTVIVESEVFNLSGEWTPNWVVAECNTLGSYCCGCSFHQNDRNFVFIEDNNCSPGEICGELDWNTQRIGNTDTVTINNWSFVDNVLTIQIQSGQSSGFQFTNRTLDWQGTYDPNTDSFTGTYTANFYGGLIISAEATGTLTLTRN